MLSSRGNDFVRSYGPKRRFFRSAGACPPRSLECADAGEGHLPARVETCEGPRPTMKETVFYRSAGALGCHTRIRAGFPRDRSMARDRPSPYVKRRRFFPRIAGPVPAIRGKWRITGRRDLPVLMRPDPGGCRRSRTTGLERAPPVVQERLLLNGLCSDLCKRQR